jgi:hypothetical protein
LSFRSRITRLERVGPHRGRCHACRTRPGSFINHFRQESLEATPLPLKLNKDDGEPCKSCGWRPEVTEIIWIMVHARRFYDLGAFDRQFNE